MALLGSGMFGVMGNALAIAVQRAKVLQTLLSFLPHSLVDHLKVPGISEGQVCVRPHIQPQESRLFYNSDMKSIPGDATALGSKSLFLF